MTKIIKARRTGLILFLLLKNLSLSKILILPNFPGMIPQTNVWQQIAQV